MPWEGLFLLGRARGELGRVGENNGAGETGTVSRSGPSGRSNPGAIGEMVRRLRLLLAPAL